ncbi:MAG: flavodoxin family protein [Bacillota bacterium]|nr:MAG: flavodoxin family protein [Bacillota bacterium]
MNYQVVFFTRTGHSKRVAEKISEGLNAPMIEINDHKHWKGIIGYIRAGFYSTVDKKVDITLSEPIDETKDIILVVPLWAGGVAPAARAFFRSYKQDRIHLVVTSIGSRVKDRTSYLSVTDIVKRDGNEDEKIAHLLNICKNNQTI